MNAIRMILFLAISISLVACSYGAVHPPSPCPSIFTYESTQPEYDRWYGVVHLTTDESLVGVRLDIRLDRQTEVLVSWMGSVTTEDNQRFTILSLDQRLHPGPPVPSRFMVRFNPSRGSPQVRTIRLNGRQICPPDLNFGTDVQPNNADTYGTSYSTERVTRRPDLDFDDDSGISRPGTGSIYSNPKRPSSNNVGSYSGSSSSNSGHGMKGDTYSPTSNVDGYNSHETYRPQNNQSSYNPRPLLTEYSPPNTASKPSISISIHKEVTYAENQDSSGYNNNNNNHESSSIARPNNDKEPSYEYPKVTDQTTGAISDVYLKPTTKKPVVFSNINININSGDSDTQSESSVYSQAKPTTRKPTVNSNKNTSNSNNNRVTTRKPTVTSNHKPNSDSGNSGRPHRNPEVSSTEYGGNNYGSNERTTTERNYQSNNNKGSSYSPTNSRPSNTDNYDTYRPSAVPSSKPDGGNKVPRPQSTSGSKTGAADIEAANANVKCGRVEVNPAPLITHGQNTARGQWPWHIALYRIEGINLSYSCGGSLITSTVVITAAHCVTKAPRDRPVDADILVVQLGKYHLYQFSDDSVQNKQVRDVYVHPRYNSTNYLDDLALLILSSPAEFTKFVRPVCLWPRHNFNLPSINNKEGTVVGWGYDENNQVTEELKMARMPVVSYVTCLKSYPQFFSQFTAENKTFCAGFRQGTSVCNGDSGGGMVFQHDNTWYLRGLVSITVAKQGLRVCDTNHYVVFTDIANYLDWIERYTS